MPVTPTYPGVYIEEIPSGVKTIVGVATSITAFIGSSSRGPTSKPTRIANFGDYERKFGGLKINSMMSYAVHQFFMNGGTDAVIVRVAHNDDAVKATIDAGGLPLEATGEGKWGNDLRVRVDYETKADPNETLFNLSIFDSKAKAGEQFRNLSSDPDSARYAKTVLDEESVFVNVAADDIDARPDASADLEEDTDNPFDEEKAGSYFFESDDNGTDGSEIDGEDVRGEQAKKTGLYALEKTDLFNILCIPPFARKSDVDESTLTAAAEFCNYRRAMLMVDPPQISNTVENGLAFQKAARTAVSAYAKNAAAFYPRLKMPDIMKENRLQEFAPCGAVAGVMARTDLQRGVWKSPAGIEAGLVGVKEFSLNMTDQENGRLNPLGINCLRNFRVTGNVVWGARTLDGADRLASEWKYLAVRRFTLFLEESLYRGTQWVVFEPNDEPLWAEIRLNVGAFMKSLFRQGAFQGKSPKDAYFVKCGSDTTTQDDINKGIVNINIGFAPLKPAEFVIIKIQQIAGDIDT